MKKVDELLSEQLFEENILKVFKIASNWARIMGDFIGRNSVPIKINKNQLIVAVSDNLWMNEFSLMKSEFLERLKEYGYVYINDIRFIVKDINKKKDPIINEFIIDEEMLKLADEFSNVIKNEELRIKYKKAFLAYLACNKNRM